MSTGDLGRLNIAENTDGSLAPIALLRWALVIIFLWFGGMKFTAYEANGIAPFIANSPFMSWLHAVFGIQGASYVIGIVELSTAAALIIGAFNAFFSALGAAMSTVTYVITLTFFASTPGVAEPTAGGFPAISAAPGQFLLKDLVLLAASVCLLAASVRHLPREPRQCDPSDTGAHGSLALTRLHSASCTAAAWIVSRGSGLRLDNRPAGTPASTKGDPSWRCASWPKRPTAIVAVGEAWRPWPPQVPPAEEGFLPKQDVSTTRTSRDLTMRNMGDPGQSVGGAIGAALGGVIAQLGSLLVALGASRYRRRLGLLAAGIVLVICANSIAQIRLNAWQGAFFDAIEQRDLTTFGSQLLVFCLIVGTLLILVVAQTWLKEMLQVRLREWLTHDLLDRWLAPKRAYLLAQAGEIGANPDQRVHEDARHLTDLSTNLAVGLLQATLLLVSFVGVLWVLSADVVFAVGDRSFRIPGYMVWCALAYAIGGSFAAWRVGRPLIALNATRYAREAELRFALVRVSENAEGIALHGSEAQEGRILDRTVDRVVRVMRELANGLTRLTWVTSGYGWLALVAPILVAAPGYFGGGLSFGGLMMVIGAFNQVQQALRWFVDNFPQIADWRATLLRVVALRDALQAPEMTDRASGRITVVAHENERLVLENLNLTLPGGRAVFEQSRVEVAPGEHVLIVVEHGSDKSALFRAIAGLSPWGAGTIRLPPRDAMMLMPPRPYLPLGSLRGGASYPAAPERFDHASVVAALQRVGLSHLLASLDREDRWDKDLCLEEQQRLAFARLLLHRPRWALLDDALGALDEGHRASVLAIFEHELAGTAVVSIGRSPAGHGFYDRTLHLRRIDESATLVPLRPRWRPLRPLATPAPVWQHDRADEMLPRSGSRALDVG